MGGERKSVHQDRVGDASNCHTTEGPVGHIEYLCLYHESDGIFEGF